jgi:starvation-inducible DNA-binding protein
MYSTSSFRNYHWNIEARNFAELHEFYEEQYNEIWPIVIDEVAERIRMLGFSEQGHNGRLSQVSPG